MTITRRTAIKTSLTAAAAALAPLRLRGMVQEISGERLPLAGRRFTSPAVESVIAATRNKIADPVLAAMFERCFPNTLDTTVYPGTFEGKPDTFVVTGDIEALWLRDSAAQVWPYLRLAKEDPKLSTLLEGLVRRHARMVLIDPYANAFTRNTTDAALPWAAGDKTEMLPGVAERKWEVDSLCYVIRLAHGYWQATGNTAPFDAQWKAAAYKIVETFKVQQRINGPGPYSFRRMALSPYDSLPLHGFGNPARPVGMIYSMFRPSDDACIYPFLIPSNLFAVQALGQLKQLAAQVLHDPRLAASCEELAGQVQSALQQYGLCHHPQYGSIWAYEVDAYGDVLMMDDANAPGLVSLPYLGICDARDPLYLRTRAFVLSSANPYFFQGTAAEGQGGPHIGLGYIWPLGITLRALTSTDESEIATCLRWLRDTTAGTGFMHESFDCNDPAKFTRSWFAWANTLFGELILDVADKHPALLRSI